MCDLPSTRWVCLPHASASKFRQVFRLYRLQHWLLMPLGVDASSGTERSKSNFSGQKYFLKLEGKRKFPPPFAKKMQESILWKLHGYGNGTHFSNGSSIHFLVFLAFPFPFKTLRSLTPTPKNRHVLPSGTCGRMPVTWQLRIPGFRAPQCHLFVNWEACCEQVSLNWRFWEW